MSHPSPEPLPTRSVRSLRLREETWDQLHELAQVEGHGGSRASMIEELVRSRMTFTRPLFYVREPGGPRTFITPELVRERCGAVPSRAEAEAILEFHDCVDACLKTPTLGAVLLLRVFRNESWADLHVVHDSRVPGLSRGSFRLDGVINQLPAKGPRLRIVADLLNQGEILLSAADAPEPLRTEMESSSVALASGHLVTPQSTGGALVIVGLILREDDLERSRTALRELAVQTRRLVR